MTGSIITTVSRVVFTLLLIGLLGIILLLLYLSRLELEEYRPALEQHLSATLQQPVSIASGSLSFGQGLGIDLYDIEIGNNRELHLRIPQIRATLALFPLLNKQIVLKNVEIFGAKATLHLPWAGLPLPAPRASRTNPYQFDIRMLTLRHAEVTIHKRGKTLAHLDNLHAIIYNWQPLQSSDLVVSGQEILSQTDFLLETTLPPLTGEHWRRLDWKAELQLGRHGTGGPATDTRAILAQEGRINLTIDGVPADGALIAVSAIPAGSTLPILHIDGIWISAAEVEHLGSLRGNLLGFPASGNIRLEHAPVRYLRATLESCELPLTAADFIAFPAVEESGFVDAILNHLLVRIDQPWPVGDESPAPLEVNTHLKLSAVTWQEPKPWSPHSLEAELTLKEGGITLTDARIHTNLSSIQASGRIDQLLTEPTFALTAEASPRLEQVLADLELPADWSISGTTPVIVKITGAASTPVFTLRADFSENRIALGPSYLKQARRPGHLEVVGKLHQNDHLELSRVDILLDPAHLVGTTTIGLGDKKPRVTVTTEHMDLTSLTSINPTFQRLQLAGKAAATLFITPEGWHGNLYLVDGGAHLTSLIGDLNKVSGRVAFDENGLHFSQLSANLGESRFTVSGDMRGWSDPLLKLQVDAPIARAQDLVFSNPLLTLYNLRGRLEIDQHGIRFDPVTVTLEESTQASVFGSVSNFSKPQTNLIIHGEKADVLDIIDLFRDPTRPSAKTTADDAPQEPITIQITAREGTLRGMRFTNARTTLIDHQGVLSIYPLTFESGGGWSRAKVEYNRHEPAAPLKISGHINGIDAATIHHDLFARPGLIRGPMTGDFYLEGDPGSDNFWAHAGGGAYVKVERGTLRRFRGLAQVFSLLNVSQIFTGRLPDMDREGMPFDLLEASFELRNGLLTTNDLKINSEAMNMTLVGKQDLVNETTDMVLGVMPLRTIDKVVSSIPIAGWVLAGEDRAILTAYFRIEGASDNPTVTAVPVNTISSTVLGVFKRTFGLPEKLIRDVGSFFQSEPVKKAEEGE